MSGILGWVGDRPLPVNVSRLQRALRLLEQRGPNVGEILLLDGLGAARSLLDNSQPYAASAILAFCRSSTRTQPAEPFDNQAVVACDGVVDNAPELSTELRTLGHGAGIASSIEVLLDAFDKWGTDCLSRLKGSFAVALLDLRRHKLILARDAFGTRPLYFARPSAGCVFFASQISALLEMASFERKVNRASLYRYLAYNVMEHGSETFFAGVGQIPAGHYLEIPLGNPDQSSLNKYRRAAPFQPILRFNDVVEQIRDLVTRTVELQVRGHNAVGAALSGGFDSSFVIAAFKRANPGVPLNLYTCVPVVKDGTFARSEEAWAELAATALHGRLNKVRVGSDDLPARFSSLVSLQEEPFSSPVVFAQLQLFRVARNSGLRLMLSGQGGDTIFSTSSNQVLRAVLEHIRRGRFGKAVAVACAASRLPETTARGLAFAAAKIVAPEGVQRLARPLRRSPDLEWLNADWFNGASGTPPQDFGLPMLRFEDRNSTSCSMLNRMPLLTTELEDFVRSLPAEYLVSADRPIKAIESAAMKGMVPDAILDRKERLGFPVPVREWLIEQASWVDLQMGEVQQLPFLEAQRVREIWESVRFNDQSRSGAFLVWRWVFLAGWIRCLDVSLD